jgi:hypothetical protein
MNTDGHGWGGGETGLFQRGLRLFAAKWGGVIRRLTQINADFWEGAGPRLIKSVSMRFDRWFQFADLTGLVWRKMGGRRRCALF